MRRSTRLPSPLAALAAAAVLATGTLTAVAADSLQPQARAACEKDKESAQEAIAKVAGLPPPVMRFDVLDQQAALESVQYALSSIGDGASYVWHRGHGRLSGVVQPTKSFKDAQGNVCRHFVMMLASGTYSKRAETVACRMPDGIWQLDG